MKLSLDPRLKLLSGEESLVAAGDAHADDREKLSLSPHDESEASPLGIGLAVHHDGKRSESCVKVDDLGLLVSQLICELCNKEKTRNAPITSSKSGRKSGAGKTELH